MEGDGDKEKDKEGKSERKLQCEPGGQRGRQGAIEGEDS